MKTEIDFLLELEDRLSQELKQVQDRLDELLPEIGELAIKAERHLHAVPDIQ